MINGNEYLDFFEKSKKLNINIGPESYSQALLKEEEKWKVRAAWIEETIEKIKKDEKLAPWTAWLEAKVDQLIDLDIEFEMIKPGRPSSSLDP